MMRAIICRFCLLAILMIPTCGLSAEEQRVALVIGNSRYRNVPELENPRKDARDIAQALRATGFQKVVVESDLTREGILEALRRFAQEAERADWSVIYYAGHGIELNGINYMVPVDAHLATDRDVQFEAIPLAQILAAAEGARKLRLVILDACRDNPFVNSMTRRIAGRSIGRGLAHVEPGGGVLVAYAAKEGQVAQDSIDGSGGNSPFVAALLRHIRTPGLEINRLFRKVRSDVLYATSNRQEPFVYGSLPDDDFYFAPPTPLAPPARDEPAHEAAATPGTAKAEAERLRADQSTPLPAPDLPPPEAKPALVPVPPPQASSQPAPIPAAPPKAAQQASPPPAPGRVAALPEPAFRTALAPDLVRSVQSELRRLGCGQGGISSVWDGKSLAVLKAFNQHAHRDLRPATISDETLRELQDRTDRVCPLSCARGFIARGDVCVVKNCPPGQRRDGDGDCVEIPKPAPRQAHVEPRRIEVEPRRRPEPRAREAAPVRRPPVAQRATPRPAGRNCIQFNGQQVCN